MAAERGEPRAPTSPWPAHAVPGPVLAVDPIRRAQAAPYHWQLPVMREVNAKSVRMRTSIPGASVVAWVRRTRT
jgi:hypothetical protein